MRIARCFDRWVAMTLPLVLAGQPAAEPTAAGTQPSPIVKAWGILFQVVECFEEYIASKALSSIHNDDALSNSAILVLVSENKKNPLPQNGEARLALLAFAREVAALHAVGDVFDQSGSEAQLKKLRSAFADMQRFYSADVLEA